MTACNVSPSYFWHKAKEIGKREAVGGCIVMVNFWFFPPLRGNAFTRISSFSSFSYSKRKILLPQWSLASVMSVKNRLWDWICHQRHLVILMDPLDTGHMLDGSIFFRCFSALWYYRNAPTLYCKTEDWALVFDILFCLVPVYKNANDDHRGGHLDYSWASLSCLFLSGLLSLNLFSNPYSLCLEFYP